MIRAPLMFLRSVQLRFTLLSFTAHLWQETSAAGEKSDCLCHQQVLLLLPQVQGFCVSQPDQQTWQAAPVVLMLMSDPTLHLHMTIFNLSKICKYANYLPALTLLPPSPCDGVRSTLGASCFFGPQVFFTIQFIHLLGKRLNTTYWFLVHPRLPSVFLSLLAPPPDPPSPLPAFLASPFARRDTMYKTCDQKW